MTDGVLVMRGNLDEVATTKGKQIVLRGVVHPQSLGKLLMGDYQREALPQSSLAEMIEAVRNHTSLPDIELGMRGARISNHGDDNFWLLDPVYVIDGQQRRNATLTLLEAMPNHDVRLGAMVHFNTTVEWERERFHILNAKRSKVSPNILMKNARHTNYAVLTLYGLSTNTPAFSMYSRVCWRQKTNSDELISAVTFAKVAANLHRHLSGASGTRIIELLPSIERQAREVTLAVWRRNIEVFFEMIDTCFGIRTIRLPGTPVYMRTAFLITMAKIINDHLNFWRLPGGNELYFDPAFIDKMKKFPVFDPTVAPLCSTSGSSRNLLQTLIINHINSGRRINKLIRRDAPYVEAEDGDEDE